MTFPKIIVLLFLVIGKSIYAQSIDSVHAFSTGKIELGMTWNELKPYVQSPPKEKPADKYYILKSGFDKNYLSFSITNVEVLVEKETVTSIQMNFNKDMDDMFIEEILTKAFGPYASTEGTGDLWQMIWHVGKYQVNLNGGEQVSQYYLYLGIK